MYNQLNHPLHLKIQASHRLSTNPPTIYNPRGIVTAPKIIQSMKLGICIVISYFLCLAISDLTSSTVYSASPKIKIKSLRPTVRKKVSPFL